MRVERGMAGEPGRGALGRRRVHAWVYRRRDERAWLHQASAARCVVTRAGGGDGHVAAELAMMKPDTAIAVEV